MHESIDTQHALYMTDCLGRIRAWQAAHPKLAQPPRMVYAAINHAARHFGRLIEPAERTAAEEAAFILDFWRTME